MFFKKLKERIMALEEKFASIAKELDIIHLKFQEQDETLDYLEEKTASNLRYVSKINAEVQKFIPNENFSEERVRGYIDEALSKSVHTNGISEDKVKSLINESIRHVTGQLEPLSADLRNNNNSNNNSGAISVNYDKICDQVYRQLYQNVCQQVYQQVYPQVYQQVYQQLYQQISQDMHIPQIISSLNSVIERNNRLENITQQNSRRLDDLENKTVSLTAEKPAQKSEYNPPEPKPVYNYLPSLSVSYPKENVTDYSALVPIKKKAVSVFSEDSAENNRALKLAADNAVKLRNEYSKILTDLSDCEVYFKTADNCVSKLKALSEKASSQKMDASKTAGELVKILKSTIIKNFSKKELAPVIDKYLKCCGFEKVELEFGKKLTDNDYEYIENSPMFVPVDSPEKNNTIVSKEHDAYVISYFDEDEDEISHKIIEGEYRIGAYKRS